MRVVIARVTPVTPVDLIVFALFVLLIIAATPGAVRNWRGRPQWKPANPAWPGNRQTWIDIQRTSGAWLVMCWSMILAGIIYLRPGDPSGACDSLGCKTITGIAVVGGVGFVTGAALGLLVYLFNRPRWAVPPPFRDETGRWRRARIGPPTNSDCAE